MAVSNLDIAEFYEQLALLVKARLPLPESLEQLGKNFRKKDFRGVLEQVSAETAQGRPLHEAMAKHPDCFPDFHLQLIKTGEESGTLQEILFEVARFAKQNQDMLAKTKETASYPVFTIFLSIVVFVAILQFVVPAFDETYREIMAVTEYYSWNAAPRPRAPIYTRIVFGLSHLVVALAPVVYVMMGTAAAALLFLFSGMKPADRLCFALMQRLPGTGRMIREADWARVSGLLGVYLKQKVALVTALRQTAELAQCSGLSGKIRGWGEMVAGGADFGDMLTDAQHGAEPLFALCVRHSPEASLGEELGELSQLYVARAEAARTRAVAIWQFITILIMTGAVGWVVISMFVPLVTIIKLLG